MDMGFLWQVPITISGSKKKLDINDCWMWLLNTCGKDM